MFSYNPTEIRIESNTIIIPSILFVFLTLVCIIFYKYNEIVSRVNLIHFVIMCLVTFLIFYIKIKIIYGYDKRGYSDTMYVLIFLFIYSFIK
jgi:hypothetical protein